MDNPTYDTPSIGYLAGFFDGEGCISMTRNGKSGLPRLTVQYTNNDLELLETIQRAWGGKIYKQSANRGPLRENRQSYVIQFNRREEQEIFLRAIIGELRGKREQALNALEFLEIKADIGGSRHSDFDRRRIENCYLRAKLLSSRRRDNLPKLEVVA